MKIETGTWVVVADGGRALFLENVGTAVQPVLRVVMTAEQENPATRDQGTDRPGRYHVPGAGGRREAVGASDWHRFAADDFARGVADRLGMAASEKRFRRLVVVAPPHALGILRDALPVPVREAVIAELAKDYTNHPIHEIERLLTSG